MRPGSSALASSWPALKPRLGVTLVRACPLPLGQMRDVLRQMGDAAPDSAWIESDPDMSPIWNKTRIRQGEINPG